MARDCTPKAGVGSCSAGAAPRLDRRYRSGRRKMLMFLRGGRTEGRYECCKGYGMLYTNCQMQGASLTAGTRLKTTRADAAAGGSFVLLRHFTRIRTGVQALERAAGQSPHSQRGTTRAKLSITSSTALTTLLRHTASSTSIFRCSQGACPHDSHRGTCCTSPTAILLPPTNPLRCPREFSA